MPRPWIALRRLVPLLLLLAACSRATAAPAVRGAGTPRTTPAAAAQATPDPQSQAATPATPGKPCVPTPWGPSTTTPIDDAPVRSSVGQGHVLRGVVRASPGCAPIAGAKIIFWLAGPDGQYDDNHRATVFTDAAGSYHFESNFPGRYSQRPQPHIHLFVSAAGYRGVELEYHPAEGQVEGAFEIVLAPAAP